MQRSQMKCNEVWQANDTHRQSYDEYKLTKVLPHIKEEFHYRVQNRLMVEKIINPRRDKTIIESLAQTTNKSFFRKRKRNRKPASVDHRRNLIVSGIIKRQIRPQTCQIQVQHHIQEHSQTNEVKNIEKYEKKECSSTKENIFQVAYDTPKCRWLLTDFCNNREASVGKIVKNREIKVSRSGIQTVYPTYRDVKMKNTATLPCESQKSYYENEKKSSMLDQYMKTASPNFKKLQRRAFHQHFHNKQNMLLSQIC